MYTAPARPCPVELKFFGDRDPELAGKVVAAVVQVLDEHRASKCVDATGCRNVDSDRS
jgi:putative lipoic acid-binding regulatory protein